MPVRKDSGTSRLDPLIPEGSAGRDDPAGVRPYLDRVTSSHGIDAVAVAVEADQELRLPGRGSGSSILSDR